MTSMPLLYKNCIVEALVTSVRLTCRLAMRVFTGSADYVLQAVK